MTNPKRELSSHASAAAAIKKELQGLFPATKFRVTSDSFSGGNAVYVRWKDSPSPQVVSAIIGKYQYGSFDGMVDLYSYDNKRDDVPQAKYVTAERKISYALALEIAEAVNAKYAYGIEVVERDGWLGWEARYKCFEADWGPASDFIYRELRDRGEEELREYERKNGRPA